jgi:Ca-activated chloride channel homolog
MFVRTLLLSLLILLTQSFVYGQDDETVIRVDSSLVVLNATVLDKSGKPVGGLKQNVFKVFEDGVEQPVSSFSSEETPFAAVLLIDTSGSMEERVTMARAAAINFLDGLRTNDNAAIYRFDSKVILVQDFSGSRDISEKIFDLKADGMTALNDAIFKAAAELSKRPEKRRAIIVLSDGQDTFSGRSAAKAMNAAQNADAAIYTIDMSAITSSGREQLQNQAALKNFAEKTGGKFITTPGGAALRQAFKGIVEELGVQYTLGYEPLNAKKDGKWRAIELQVARPNLTIRTRKGYTAGK